MRICTAVIEKFMDAGLSVGCVSGFSGANSRGETLIGLNGNLREAIEMLLDK